VIFEARPAGSQPQNGNNVYARQPIGITIEGNVIHHVHVCGNRLLLSRALFKVSNSSCLSHREGYALLNCIQYCRHSRREDLRVVFPIIQVSLINILL